MEIQFIGATVDVTGSMTMLTNLSGKILVDSGMYQGTQDVALRNRSLLPFEPDTIEAIILTHAHLDHSGFIPRLVKLGFRGAIYCTKPTMKLAMLIMSDSAKILNNEAHPLHKFYEPEDVSIATSLFKTKSMHEVFNVLGMEIKFFPAGHILGAASVIIKGDKTIVFSGDLGRQGDPLIDSPEPCPPADMVIMESTYGDRTRHGLPEEELNSFLRQVKKKSQIGVIASFAVSRAQVLITLIHKFYEEHPEERVRFVIDSPMMMKANNIYKEFSQMTKIPLELKAALDEVEVIDELREWESIRKQEGPLIVVTSSGMVSGGRIWRYLENWQQETNACLFLPGYQGAGTSGKLLSEGERVIFDEKGKKVHWHGEIRTSGAFSSHADQHELISWLKNVEPETQIYLNHGGDKSKYILREELLKRGYKHVDIAYSSK
jgi:metallo-beta-lactamase family protein